MRSPVEYVFNKVFDYDMYDRISQQESLYEAESIKLVGGLWVGMGFLASGFIANGLRNAAVTFSADSEYLPTQAVTVAMEIGALALPIAGGVGFALMGIEGCRIIHAGRQREQELRSNVN